MKRLLLTLLLLAAVLPTVAAPSQAADPTPTCTITGTDGADAIDGTAGADIICALGGDDVINAGGGNDVIIAGDGNDTIDAGAGNDTVYAGAGDDRIAGGPGGDLLWAGDGSDVLRGAAGNDVLMGGPGADSEYGDAGVDYCEIDPADPVNASCFRDNNAPKPIAAAFLDSRINAQASEQVTYLRVRIKDFGTGVNGLQASIAGAMYQFSARVEGLRRCLPDEHPEAGTGCLRSGDGFHGIWEFAFRIPRYIPATRIQFTELMLSDAAGNERYVEIQGDLAVSFRTLGAGDAIAPVLRSVTPLGRPTLDASRMTELAVTLSATDNLSGIAGISVNWGMAGCFNYKSGWLNKKVCSSATSTNTMVQAGFEANGDGTFTGRVSPQTEMFNGVWVPYLITLVDNTGNRRELDGIAASRFANALAFTVAHGKPFKLADSEDPVLQSVTLSPARVNTAGGPATVVVRLYITDNKSVGNVWASAMSPNGYSAVALDTCPRESGTAKAGIWACPVTLPSHGATGYWQVYLTVTDTSNNQARWSPEVSAAMNGNGYRIRNG